MPRRSTYYGATARFINDLSTQFNGVNQYTRNNGAHRFGSADSFTLSGWFKISNVTPNQFLISCASGSGAQGYILRCNGGKIGFFVVQAGYGNGQFISIESGVTVVNNTWYHIMVTYQGSIDRPGVRSGALDLTMYIDGVATGTGAGTINNAFTNSNQFQINGFAGGIALSANNTDEATIYDEVKDAAFAAALYGAGSPTDRTGDGNVSWYRMGDGDSSPTINDNTGTDDLTMINMSNANFVNDTP